MTPDQITSLAKQAGFLIDEAPISQPYVIRATRYKIDDELRRFAELVRNEVLEEAAKVCDGNADRARTSTGAARADACADAIRGLKS